MRILPDGIMVDGQRSTLVTTDMMRTAPIGTVWGCAEPIHCMGHYMGESLTLLKRGPVGVKLRIERTSRAGYECSVKKESYEFLYSTKEARHV